MYIFLSVFIYKIKSYIRTSEAKTNMLTENVRSVFDLTFTKGEEEEERNFLSLFIIPLLR